MKQSKAFTLIETLIYIGIFSIVALSLSGILWNTLQINSNQQAANEVDENLRYVMSILNEKVRASTAIVATTTPGVLVLKGPVYQDVYNIFSVTNGVLYFQEGAGTPVAVTSNQVLVDSLIFTRIEMAGAKDGVRVDITLSYNSDKPELAFSKNLISTVNRVSAITFDSDILPDVDNSRSVGDINQSWKNGYFSGDLSIEGNETLTGNLTVDTNSLYVNSANGYVGIGTISPATTLHAISTSASSPRGITTDQYSTDSGGSRLEIRKARGTLASPTTIVSGDVLSNIGSWGYDGTSWLNPGSIAVIAEGTVGTGVIPSYMRFQTANTSGTLVERMRITSAGYIGVATSTPTEMLEVNGNIRLSGGTPTYKIKNVSTPTDSSDVATKGYVDAAGTTYTQYVAYYTTAGTATWTNPNGAASTTVSVIVVAGGGGGGGGSNSAGTANTGSTGGTSSFGALASATGGIGGTGGGSGTGSAPGGTGYNGGGPGAPADNTGLGNTGGAGGVGFQGCGSGGTGAGAWRGSGAGGGSGYVDEYYGVTAASSITVTVGAGGGGGASTLSTTTGAAGAPGCVIVTWWDN